MNHNKQTFFDWLHPSGGSVNHYFVRVGVKDHIRFQSLCGLTPAKALFPENYSLTRCKNCLNDIKWESHEHTQSA